MDIPDFLGELANIMRHIPETEERVYYPPIQSVTTSPTTIIRYSNDIPTRYIKDRAGRQTVHLQAEIVILVEAVNQLAKPEDEAKIDQLIGKYIDLFDLTAYKGSVNTKFPTFTDHVNQVWYDASVKRQSLNYGGIDCYVAIIVFDSVFRRTAQEVVLEDYP